MTPPFQRLALSLDRPPLGELHRIVVGFLVIPLSRMLDVGMDPGWSLAGVFAGALIAYRIVPLVFRKLVRSDRTTNAAWSERRQLAKRFDSYQWRKLLWFGIGMTIALAATDDATMPVLTLVAVCLASGAAGLAFWRYRQRALHGGVS